MGRITAWAVKRFDRLVKRRGPDVVIGGRANPYMMRWYLIPHNRLLNIYLHLVMRDDDDRALHDHPWWNLSWVLDGEYLEHRILQGGVHILFRRVAGDVIIRRARTAHRLALVNGSLCWSLFITGPKCREWGFHCPSRWIHWRDFTSEDGASVGAGCGEEL